MSGLFKDTKEAFSIALELKNKGWKYGDVADHLNVKGFKNQHGNAWDKHTVSRLMVAHNVRRKKPRSAKTINFIEPNPVVGNSMLLAAKSILGIQTMPLQLRVDTVLTLLEGVQ